MRDSAQSEFARQVASEAMSLSATPSQQRVREQASFARREPESTKTAISAIQAAARAAKANQSASLSGAYMTLLVVQLKKIEANKRSLSTLRMTDQFPGHLLLEEIGFIEVRRASPTVLEQPRFVQIVFARHRLERPFSGIFLADCLASRLAA